MNNSLLQFAISLYAADLPHESIINSLISKGASPSEAQHILDIATITYCTQNGQVSQQSEPAEEEVGFGAIIKVIFSIIGLVLAVVKCMN
ncbi:hypothetical protein [Emticicia sp. 21SJ11W-3]|uniref:hypothetical protein n=1 Tax=Emticicia sp. 21SJ11W-3 TaxID=2916755 RepID=UPI00209E6A1E|nr:hypothetical protein [Emticicia sp. 21SJ11W-3]UTA66910.1 hypothetical protein MB380_15000 [Emticicia sp. 21SJ11W-3]